MNKSMVFLGLLLTGLLVVSAAAVPLQAAVPASERAALIALYNAANGDNWTDNSGWKGNNNEPDGFSQTGSEGSWYGITVSGDHVYSIYLNSNQLSGTIPAGLGNLGSMEYFYLSENQLSGSIPAALGNLASVKNFVLANNQLTGSIPPELGNLANLGALNLSGNQLSGSIPPELGNLASMWGLGLENNQLSGSIPPQLGNLANLEGLSLDNNQLTGSIPPELGNLAKLETLYLNDNLLTGSIPEELATPGNLRYLVCSANQLSGTIPPELGSTGTLQRLFLDGNQLTGSIPPELGNLGNLRYLYLDNNGLSGAIPTELGNLTTLYALRLHANRLSGAIPASLTNLTGLWSGYFDIGYNALYTDDQSLRAFLNSYTPSWQTSQTTAPSGVSATALSAYSIRVSWVPIAYSGNSGGYKIYYSTTSGGPWVYAGMTSAKLASSYDITGLNPGTGYYLAVKTQTDPHNNNANTVVSEYSEEVYETTNPPGPDTAAPFGSFDTPSHGSTVSSSLPVTGWALDDSGIASVKIYRQQGSGLVYIGDASLVEGARPDVAAAYPGYPYNTRAGWGYMMLTNFLPGGGNGNFELHVIATDIVGKSTTLGTKTIVCDNANAVKPFGAIDTPTQGGIAAGDAFINWGWVLTPQPNSIPEDGSTINVFVDGVNIGHPNYNIYRSDIAGLFPEYANSNGAIGYFYLDTTAYEDGVHTIQWTARDTGNNSDGIGSRYFVIQNTGENRNREKFKVDCSQIPVDDSQPVRVKKGYGRNTIPQTVYPGEKGDITIEINEVQRLEIHFFAPKEPTSNLEHRTLNNISPLPVGSTLDTERGVLYWQPGPGFIGEYRFLFIEKIRDRSRSRKEITVRIVPKFVPQDREK